MSDAHSKYSASGFEAAMLCPGKPVMERGLPNPGSKYSDEGTAAHTLLHWCLSEGKDAAAFIGATIVVGDSTFTVDDEMAGYIQTVIGNTHDAAGDGMILSDQRVTYGPAIGVSEAEGWGTLDTTAIRGDELQIRDLKYGRGVEVFAEYNPQMMLYALGALAAVGDLFGPIKTVRFLIDQPRIKSAPSEWACSVEDLLAWGAGEATRVVQERQGAERLRETLKPREWEAIYLRPGDKSCKFCRAKARCPALRNAVAATVIATLPASPDEFDVPSDAKEHVAVSDADWLAAALSQADMIEDWIKAVRAEAERRLLAGDTVPGFKIVEGRAGNRAWNDKAKAEATMKAMRLTIEQMYDLSLISPTTAEKLLKAGTIGPRQWKSLQDMVTRADGKKHVAPNSDPRPALSVTAVEEDFSTVVTD